MKIDQFTNEFQHILSRQPGFRLNLFLWIFWIYSVLIGALFMMIMVANLVNGSLSHNLIRLLFEREPILSAGGRHYFVYLVSAVCMALSLHAFSMAWLIHLVLQRNTHIMYQNEFILRVLDEYKQKEHLVYALKEDFRKQP